jgi:hypothetical protein
VSGNRKLRHAPLTCQGVVSSLSSAPLGHLLERDGPRDLAVVVHLVGELGERGGTMHRRHVFDGLREDGGVKSRLVNLLEDLLSTSEEEAAAEQTFLGAGATFCRFSCGSFLGCFFRKATRSSSGMRPTSM